MQLVAALFPDRSSAERALEHLEHLGIASERVSVVMREQGELQREEGRPQAEISTASGDGALEGMAFGGLLGLLASAAALLIPGIGGILAIGPLAATLSLPAVGAATGAFAGGIVGGLIGAGLSQQEADAYAEGVKRGQILLTVQAETEQAPAIAEALRKTGALDINAQSSAWRAESARGLDPASAPEADFPPLKMPE
jgi:uncharacterized membrane protein